MTLWNGSNDLKGYCAMDCSALGFCPTISRVPKLQLAMSEGAHLAQCARSATIWASGHTRDPYFEIIGAPRGIMVTLSGGFEL